MLGNATQQTYTGKNLCNGVNTDYYLGTNTQVAGRLTNNSGLIVSVDGTSNYTVSTTGSQTRYRVACIDTTLEYNATTTGYNGQNKDGTSNSITIDTTGHSYLLVNATDLSKIQVEKGSSATSYEPYTRTEKQVQVLTFLKMLM